MWAYAKQSNRNGSGSNKGLAKRQPRNLAQSYGAYNSLYNNPMYTGYAQDWPEAYSTASYQQPDSWGRGTDPLTRSMSADGWRNSETRARQPNSTARSTDPSLFKKTCSALYGVLSGLRQFAEQAGDTFDREMVHIQDWAPADVLKSLWQARMQWDGVSRLDGNSDRVRNENKPLSFIGLHAQCERHSEELYATNMNAIDLLKYSDTRMTELDVRAALSKLDLALQYIRKLLQLVRDDRTKIKSLEIQVHDAMTALGDIGELWQTDSRYSGNQPNDRGDWR